MACRLSRPRAATTGFRAAPSASAPASPAATPAPAVPPAPRPGSTSRGTSLFLHTANIISVQLLVIQFLDGILHCISVPELHQAFARCWPSDTRVNDFPSLTHEILQILTGQHIRNRSTRPNFSAFMLNKTRPGPRLHERERREAGP